MSNSHGTVATFLPVQFVTSPEPAIAIIFPSPTNIKFVTIADVDLPSSLFSCFLDDSDKDFTLCLPWGSDSSTLVPDFSTVSSVNLVSTYFTVSVSIGGWGPPGSGVQ